MTIAEAQLQEAISDLDWIYGVKASLPGGEYRAEQNPDGSWNVFDVPMFAAHKATDVAGEPEIGRDWQEGTVKRHQQLWNDDGYLAPLIVNHHELMQDRPGDAGFFLPTQVVDMQEDGKVKPVTLCNYLYVNEWVYGAIRQGRLPYVSSEFIFEGMEHQHLSMLKTEAPWFRFKMVTVGKEKPFIEEGEAVTDFPEAAPVVAVRARQKYMTALRRAEHKGLKMPKPAIKPATRAADDTTNDDTTNKEAGASLGEVMTTLGEISTSITAALDGIKKMVADALGVQQGDEGADDSGKPVEDGDSTRHAHTMAATRAAVKTAATPLGDDVDPAVVTRMAGMQAQIDTLTSQETVRNAEESIQIVIRQAVKDLRDYNIPGIEDTLTTMAKDPAMGGEIGIKAYVAATKANARKAPPADWNGDLAQVSDQDPQEVIAYASAGSEKMQAARRSAASFKLSKSNGHVKESVTLTKWLARDPLVGAVPS